MDVTFIEYQIAEIPFVEEPELAEDPCCLMMRIEADA
jgi:hypothetical protein